jgi:2-hydroxychromene-2-carboxylate isomerase
VAPAQTEERGMTGPGVERVVDYYFAVVSPWSYLGHARLAAMAAARRAVVNVKPIDLSRVFPVSGGLPQYVRLKNVAVPRKLKSEFKI